MKKLAGIVFALMMVSIVLTGCYSKSCDQPQATAGYKGGQG